MSTLQFFEQNVQKSMNRNTQTYKVAVVKTVNGISYNVEFDYGVRMTDLIDGGERVKVIEKHDVAPWERPLINFRIPPGSRPGDKITIPKGWTTRDELFGYNIVITLRLCNNPMLVLSNDDVYIKQTVKTNMKRNVGKVRIEFPDGEVRYVDVNRVARGRFVLKFTGRGMPRRCDRTNGQNGDFYIIMEPILKKCRPRRFVSDMCQKLKSCLTGTEMDGPGFGRGI